MLVAKVVGIDDVEDTPTAPAVLLDELDVAGNDELGPTAPAVEELVLALELVLAAPAVELRLKLGVGLALMAPTVELRVGVGKENE